MAALNRGSRKPRLPQAPPRQPGVSGSAGPRAWGGHLELHLKATPIFEKCLQIEYMPVNPVIVRFRYYFVTLLHAARLLTAKYSPVRLV